MPNGAVSKKKLPMTDLLANVLDEVLRTRGISKSWKKKETNIDCMLGYQDGFKTDEFFVRDAMSGNKLSIYKYVHQLPKELTPYTDPATHMKIFKLNIDFIHVCSFLYFIFDYFRSSIRILRSKFVCQMAKRVKNMTPS